MRVDVENVTVGSRAVLKLYRANRAPSPRSYPLLVWNGGEWQLWEKPQRGDEAFLRSPGVVAYRLPASPSVDEE